MLDVIILNRNLGRECDALVASLSEHFNISYSIVVVDAGSEPSNKSQHTVVTADDQQTVKDGLRFGRGMNLGLEHIQASGSSNSWVLMLPVDAQVVFSDIVSLLELVDSEPLLAAVKPLSSTSAYRDLLGERSLAAAWNVEEGPWLIRRAFIDQQRERSRHYDFFDRENFRGYLTSMDLAFRIYSNGFWMGVSNLLVIDENEELLLNHSALIKTDPFDENQRKLVKEGVMWLKEKYSMEDPWAFAQITRLAYEQFMVEHPELQRLRFEATYEAC